MQILKDYEQVIQIIKDRAVFQKVMILHDQSFFKDNIFALYEQLKDCVCINKLDLINDDLEEVYNGYRVLIFCCSADSFIRCRLNLDEFVCVFLPTDDNVLPFYVDSNYKNSKAQNFLYVKNSKIDLSMYASLCFCKLMACANSLIGLEFEQKVFEQIENQDEMSLLNMDCELCFVDIKILHDCKIAYEYLPIVDYLLTIAISLLFRAVKLHKLEIVDIYKNYQEDYIAIDRFYALLKNDTMLEAIELNYDCTKKLFENTSKKLANIVNINLTSNLQVLDEIVEKLKIYCKDADGILGLLFIYNVFG